MPNWNPSQNGQRRRAVMTASEEGVELATLFYSGFAQPRCQQPVSAVQQR